MSRIPVDRYFKINRTWDGRPQYDNMNSIFEALDYDDFEAIYGLEDGEYELSSPRNDIYRLNKAHPENLIVLFSCNHSGRKVRHHPDYSKPFEIELICERCHYARHYAQRNAIMERLDLYDQRGKRLRSLAASPQAIVV